MIEDRYDMPAPSPAKRGPSLLEVIDASILATPAAAYALIAWSPRGSRASRAGAAVLCLATAIAAIFLLREPLPWQPVTIGWLAYVVLGTAAVAFWARSGDRLGKAVPGWRRLALPALAIAFLLAPLILFFARITGAALAGSLLARLDPGAADPQELLQSVVTGALWAVPVAWLFAVASLRRGRLHTAADLLRAALSWTVVLILYELMVGGTIGALDRLMWGAELGEGIAAYQEPIIRIVFIVATFRLAGWLAWSERRLPVRIAATIALIAVGLVNLCLLTGFTPRVHFARARYLERNGRVEAALAAYDKSLAGRSTPSIESYLQHRIGLLNYKLGREDLARDAFRSVVTRHDANDELVEQSSYYLKRLESADASARRVVLAGVEVATEHRGAYCAPNTLSLVVGHWGIDRSPGEIGQDVAHIGGGTSGSAIHFLCQRLGLDHMLLSFATVDDIRWLIDRQIPALIYVPQHVLAVFGYDDRLGTVIAYDTNTWDIWVDKPIPELLADWGEDRFQLGVVIPRGAPGELAAEIGERFPRAEARASTHYWLSQETADRDYRDAHLRASLIAAPAFYPAAFNLPAREFVALGGEVDASAIVAAARATMGRRHSPTSIALDLTSWLLRLREHERLLTVADELETLGLADRASWTIGIAAARTGDHERASGLLRDSEGGLALLELARAEHALGHDERAAQTLLQLAEEDAIRQQAAAIPLADELADGRRPGFLATMYKPIVDYQLASAEQFVRFAEVSLLALDERDVDARSRLQDARRAATRGLALAETEPLRGRARAILADLEAQTTSVLQADE